MKKFFALLMIVVFSVAADELIGESVKTVLEQNQVAECTVKSIVSYVDLVNQTIEKQFPFLKQWHTRLQRNEKIFYGTMAAAAIGLVLYNKRNSGIDSHTYELAEKIKLLEVFQAAGGKFPGQEVGTDFISYVHWALSPVYSGVRFFKNQVVPSFIGNSLIGHGLYVLKDKMTGVFSLDYVLRDALAWDDFMKISPVIKVHYGINWYDFLNAQPAQKVKALSIGVENDQLHKEALRSLQLFEEALAEYFEVMGTVIAYVQYQQEIVDSASVVYLCDQEDMRESLTIITNYVTSYAALLDGLVADYKQALDDRLDGVELTDKKIALQTVVVKLVDELIKPEVLVFERAQATLVHQSVNISQTWLSQIVSMGMPILDGFLFKPALKEVFRSSVVQKPA